MDNHVIKVSMPDGFKDLPRAEVEALIENAIKIINPDISVGFAYFMTQTGIQWHTLKKNA